MMCLLLVTLRQMVQFTVKVPQELKCVILHLLERAKKVCCQGSEVQLERFGRLGQVVVSSEHFLVLGVLHFVGAGSLMPGGILF